MSTSDFDINRYYQGNKMYGGCYCKDQLINKKPRGKFYVINLQDSDEGNGTHWVLVSDIRPLPPTYIDPYGVSPPPEITAFLQRSESSKRPIYSKLQYQDLNSQRCGQFVIAFMDRLLLYRYEHDWQDDFDDELTPAPSRQNELLAERLKRKM